MSQLMTSQKFAPYFWAQFLGAFNNNVFKNALAIMITYKTVSEADSGMLVEASAGLFILPFVLFSSLAGQWSDKYEKGRIIRIVKFSELMIISLAVLGFYWDSIHFLMFVLLLMGVQTAFFGPVKYSLLPQAVAKEDMVWATSLVEMGTFASILMGTILGGILAPKSGWQESWVISLTVFVIALTGWVVSLFIPKVPRTHPELKIEYNPFKQYFLLWKVSQQKISVYQAIIAISWFWFLGAALLSQLPTYVNHFLHGNEGVITCLLTSFTLSLAVGSLLNKKLSVIPMELGLVPLGALGMSLFLFDLAVLNYPQPEVIQLTVGDFLMGKNIFTHWRILVDFFMIGCFGSFYIVPLYSLLQQRSSAKTCSQVIAANNLFNALFMVVSAILIAFLYKLEFATVDIFAAVAIFNFLINIYVFFKVPEFILRFGFWLMAKSLYHYKIVGQETLPSEKGLFISIKQVSLSYWLIVSAICQRELIFILSKEYFSSSFKSFLLKTLGAIAYDETTQRLVGDPVLREKVEEKIKTHLEKEGAVCFLGGAKHLWHETFAKSLQSKLNLPDVPFTQLEIGQGEDDHKIFTKTKRSSSLFSKKKELTIKIFFPRLISF